VRREKALFFSGCESRPGTGSLHPLQGVFPHAHLLCREIKVTATFPDGAGMPLIWIKDWDWNWQGEYLYTNPIILPPGT